MITDATRFQIDKSRIGADQAEHFATHPNPRSSSRGFRLQIRLHCIAHANHPACQDSGAQSSWSVQRKLSVTSIFGPADRGDASRNRKSNKYDEQRGSEWSEGSRQQL